VPVRLEAITLQLTLRRRGLVARTSLEFVPLSFLPFTRHSFENPSRQRQRTPPRIVPDKPPAMREATTPSALGCRH
jgi:hypothetical protein